MNQLEPCPECQRHVRISDAACPFCAAPLAEAFANVAPRILPRVRLGRAATFAFGVVALAQGGCTERGRSPDAAVTSDGGLDAPPDDADDGGVAIYSAAPTPDKQTPPATSG